MSQNGKKIMQRREFLKLSATAGAVTCITACGGGGKSSEKIQPKIPLKPENVDWSSCTCDCFLNCSLKVYSRDGVVTRVESEGQAEGQDVAHGGVRQNKACYRGRSNKQRVNAAGRLKYPMKRVGPRGEGRFERISWDQAFQMIATNLKNVSSPESIIMAKSSGTLNDGFQAGEEWIKRLLNLNGGFLDTHGGGYSFGQFQKTSILTYGNFAVVTTESLVKSDFVLSFGWNPNENTLGGGGFGYEWSRHCDELNKKGGTVLIDPRYTDSMLGKESDWVPIRPGTDAALAEALAYEIFIKDAVDQKFLDDYCSGHDESHMPASLPDEVKKRDNYKSYILGENGNTAKTPEYAAKITGIPAEKIKDIADRLIKADTPFIAQGWSIQRSANGEQACRALMMLPLLIGKFGHVGMGTASLPGFGFNPDPVGMAVGEAKIKGNNPVKHSIEITTFIKAVELGKKYKNFDFDIITHDDAGNMINNPDDPKYVKKLNHDIEFIWCYATNTLVNQSPNAKYNAKVMKDPKVKFIVCHDIYHTSSTAYADLILPGTLDIEQDDMLFGVSVSGATAIACSTSVKPAFEAKTSYEVCEGVAGKLGLKNSFTGGKTFDEWMRGLWSISQVIAPNLGMTVPLPDYDEMRKLKIHKQPLNKRILPLQEFIADPEKNPLGTPSKKIEMFSSILAGWEYAKDYDKKYEAVHGLPKYVSPAEGFETDAVIAEKGDQKIAVSPDADMKDGWNKTTDKVSEKYPLQLSNFHGKQRVHSMFENVPWVREVNEDVLWINPLDAGILKSGDKVIVETLRGKCKKTLRVTPRIMPGVISMPEGAYHKMQNDIDVGGCMNTLTTDRLSPISKGIAPNTNRAKVYKA